MIEISCPYCEKEHGVEEVKQKETIKFKGHLVEYCAEHLKCKACGEIFDTKELLDRNILSIRRAYEDSFERISPELIVSTRKKYNASQKVFGIILGMGELTINSYEQGKSIPNPTNRLLLKLAQNPLYFFGMYSINKDKIGMIQRKRIENSEAMYSVERWQGLENLYSDLSSSERITIENKTYTVGSPVRQIVTDMVKAELNKEAFEIFNDAHGVESTIHLFEEKATFISGEIA